MFLFFSLLCSIGSDDAVRFQGNTTSKDHFRLLQADGEYVLVGARYVITSFYFGVSQFLSIDRPDDDFKGRE